MNKAILKKGDRIVRCLDSDDGKLLVIDCVKRTMPYWVDNCCLADYEEVGQEWLLERLRTTLPSIDKLSQDQQKTMHVRYAMISPILASAGDEGERRRKINEASSFYEVSAQTIRHRLCDYLVFQDIAALAPSVKKVKELSEDEKNFRWALNKFFYRSQKLSLRQTYKYLIKEKYMGSDGKILQNCPKFHRFKYFYYKTRNESNFIISRLGRGEYDRNHRPLLGDGVREFCPTIGYGMMDSTTCDIYLVNEAGELIGRPIMTACVDAFSGMCLGYSIGWEGGTGSLKKLMFNVVSDKVEHCRRFGIEISVEDWDCHWIPHKLITDKGTEYVGDNFSQLVDLGVEFINLEPYRPELKPIVERFFGLIQESFKKELINKGVVLKDFGDRGAIDYRKNACLTLGQFEKIVVLCIIHYNCGRAIELPRGFAGLNGHCKDLWNRCLQTQKDNLIEVSGELLRLTLLPRCEGRFKRDGLIVNRLRYRASGFTNDYLKGGVETVAYDPDDVSHVWLLRDGRYHEFALIENYFKGMKVSDAEHLLDGGPGEESRVEELESEIRLSKAIELVAGCAARGKVRVKGVRKNRKKEIVNN